MPRSTRSKHTTRGRAKGRAKTTGKRSEATNRRAIAEEYFRLIGQGQFEEGLKFFAPECRTHNPFFAGDMVGLTKAMRSASEETAPQFSDPAFTVEHVLVDGDLVAVHTHMLGSRTTPGVGGLRQIHLFRFRGDKIVEYWDITQQVTPDLPNAAGAF